MPGPNDFLELSSSEKGCFQNRLNRTPGHWLGFSLNNRFIFLSSAEDPTLNLVLAPRFNYDSYRRATLCIYRAEHRRIDPFSDEKVCSREQRKLSRWESPK